MSAIWYKNAPLELLSSLLDASDDKRSAFLKSDRMRPSDLMLAVISPRGDSSFPSSNGEMRSELEIVAQFELLSISRNCSVLAS